MLSRISMVMAATCVSCAALLSMGGDATAQTQAAPPGPPGERMGGPMHRPEAGPMAGMMGLAAEFDPAQLPEFKGKVAQYTLSPRGMVDGFFLADGTEVKFPPFLSNAVVFAIKPGDQVVIHGLKARNEAMVVAASLTNPASGAVIGGDPAAIPGMHRPPMTVAGKVKAALHNPRGEINGALLEDGTTVRMPPHVAAKYAELLKPGATLAAKGPGVSNALGKSMVAFDLGESADKLSRVIEWHHEHAMGDGPEGRGPHGPMHGPMPGAGAPPPPQAAH